MKKNYCFSFNGNLDEFNTTVKRYIENKDDDFLWEKMLEMYAKDNDGKSIDRDHPGLIIFDGLLFLFF